MKIQYTSLKKKKKKALDKQIQFKYVSTSNMTINILIKLLLKDKHIQSIKKLSNFFDSKLGNKFFNIKLSWYDYMGNNISFLNVGMVFVSVFVTLQDIPHLVSFHLPMFYVKLRLKWKTKLTKLSKKLKKKKNTNTN